MCCDKITLLAINLTVFLLGLDLTKPIQVLFQLQWGHALLVPPCQTLDSNTDLTQQEYQCQHCLLPAW